MRNQTTYFTQYVSYLISLLLLSQITLAQPSILSEHLPKVGTEHVVHISEELSLPAGVASSEAQSWDFTELSVSDSKMIQFIDPAQARGYDDLVENHLSQGTPPPAARIAPIDELLGFGLMDILANAGLYESPSPQPTLGHLFYKTGLFQRMDRHRIYSNFGGSESYGFIMTGLEDMGFATGMYMAPMLLGDSIQDSGYMTLNLYPNQPLFDITVHIEVDHSHIADAFGQIHLPEETFNVLRIAEETTYQLTAEQWPDDIVVLDTSFVVKKHRFHSTEKDYPVAIAIMDPTSNGAKIKEIEFLGSESDIYRESLLAFDHNPSCMTAIFDNRSVFMDTYLWDFGDGNTSTFAHPMHTYEQEGQYLVTLTGVDYTGTSTSISQMIEVDCSPIADFMYIERCPSALFRNLSTNAESYLWDFGFPLPPFSEFQLYKHPAYPFPGPGTYPVSLTVYGMNGDSAKVTHDVNIICQPVAQYWLNDQDYDCDGIGLYNESLHDVSHEWYINGELYSTSDNTQLQQDNCGEFDITLIVTGETGLQDSTSTSILFYCNNSGAFSIEQDSLNCNTYTFTNECPQIESNWDFGDNHTASGHQVTHTFAEDGLFTVTNQSIPLTLTNDEMLLYSEELDVQCAKVLLTDFQIAYNTLNGQLDIICPGAENTILDFSLYNLLGQQVLSKRILAQSQLSLLIGGVSHGMYIAELRDAEGQRVSVKTIPLLR